MTLDNVIASTRAYIEELRLSRPTASSRCRTTTCRRLHRRNPV